MTSINAQRRQFQRENWDETHSNYIGTGRNVARFFTLLGDRLDRLVHVGNSSGQARRSPGHAAAAAAAAIPENHLTRKNLDDTMSGMVGPGRNFDRFYSFLGHSVDDIVGRWAHQVGIGPDASAQRIFSSLSTAPNLRLNHRGSWAQEVYRNERLDTIDWPSIDSLPQKKRVKIEKECWKLIKDTHCPDDSVQYRAIESIFTLACLFPDLQYVFARHNTTLLLETLPSISLYSDQHRDYLLSSSRKALVSLQENAVNISGKELVSLLHVPTQSRDDSWSESLKHCCWTIHHFQHLDINLDLRYVALQYARHPGISRSAQNNELVLSTRLFLGSCEPAELRQIIKLVSDIVTASSFTARDIADYFKLGHYIVSQNPGPLRIDEEVDLLECLRSEEFDNFLNRRIAAIMQAHMDWSHTEGPPPPSALGNSVEDFNEEEQLQRMEALNLMGKLDDAFPYQVDLSTDIIALDLSSSSCVCEECLLSYLSTDDPFPEETFFKIHDLSYSPYAKFEFGHCIS